MFSLRRLSGTAALVFPPAMAVHQQLLRSTATTAEASGASGNHFDLLVIGGGSGGIACSKRAASYGASVAVVERPRHQAGGGEGMGLGGTCVNVGCVPKKIMWNTATVKEVIEGAQHFGYSGTEGVQFDWSLIKRARDATVRRLNGIYQRGLDKAGVQVIAGEARFTGNREVTVDGKTYTADHIVITVGGEPSPLGVPGEEHTINSDQFFDLETQPGKVAVVGAGYIAVEMAGIFNALGTDTSLFVRGNMALRRFDSMIATELDRAMRQSGINVNPGSTPKAITKNAFTGKLTLELQNGDTHSGFDQILVATGRGPLSERLGLANTDIRLNAKGYVNVDEYQNSSVPNVYALGDVAGKIELTPMAIAAGRRLADRLFGGMPSAKASYDDVPTVIFSHPPIGTVGLSEAEAQSKYGADNIKVYNAKFPNMYYTTWDVPAEQKPKTAMKVICAGENERVVGLHIIGMGADEMMQGFGVAVKMGATKADLDDCVAIHPTAGEEIVTMFPWGLSKPHKDRFTQSRL